MVEVIIEYSNEVEIKYECDRALIHKNGVLAIGGIKSQSQVFPIKESASQVKYHNILVSPTGWLSVLTNDDGAVTIV